MARPLYVRIVLAWVLLATLPLWPCGCTRAIGVFSNGESAVRRIPAFPGAEGAGAFAVGGRGGKVYEVVTLQDGGPGSLREAVEAEGPRIVVFRVAGPIALSSTLFFRNPNITVAGQTAPGDGVCITSGSLRVDTSEVVLRYLRVRCGAPGAVGDDGLGGRPIRNIVVDHCSCSWAGDENISLFKQDDPDNDDIMDPAENVTVQWSISGETAGARFRSFGVNFGGKNCSYHHNLFACNIAWEPRPAIACIPPAQNLDLRNNVFYSWRSRKMDGAQLGGSVNFVGNYWKFDPTKMPTPPAFFQPDGNFKKPKGMSEEPAARWGKWHVAGNFVEGHPDITADNWKGAQMNKPMEELRVDAPFPFAPISEQSAEEAYRLVLEGAGADLPVRDSVDRRIVEATRTNATYYGELKKPLAAEYFLLPEYKTGEAPADSDHDGMPDEWETKNGLNPNDAADGPADKDGDGYTNVEEWLNGTDPSEFVDYTKAENNRNTLR